MFVQVRVSIMSSVARCCQSLRTNPKSFEDFILRSRNETFPEVFFLEDPKAFEEALGEDLAEFCWKHRSS